MEDPVDNQTTKKDSNDKTVSKQDSVTQVSTVASTNTSSSENKPAIRDGLLSSFNTFDAFLKDRPSLPADEESVWTEVTIEQESVAKYGSIAQSASEEEQSYMEFTVDESTAHESYIEETVVSGMMSNQPQSNKGQSMISPFMSNLLSSRLYQDIAPTVPAQKTNNNLGDHLDQTSKKFPSITVNSAHDDDMTQLTMDHSFDEEDDDHNDGDYVESKNVKQDTSNNTSGKKAAPEQIKSRPSVSKTPSIKSKQSLKSRKSSVSSTSGSSHISSESSKQRIAEILRKDVWSRDASVVQSGMEELSKYAKRGRKYRAHIVRCGGVMAITRTMEMNADDEIVQIACCEILEKLATDPETQSAICEMAGISLVVRSMQDHADNAKVQEAACGALASICRRQESEDLKDSIKDANGAVYTLLTSMTRYSDSPRIQAKAFASISNLCMESHERLSELSEAGGIMTLTLALQKPWENKHEQHEAISNLSILLRGVTELNASPIKPSKVDNTDESSDDDGENFDDGSLSSHSSRFDSEPQNNDNPNEQPAMETTSSTSDGSDGAAAAAADDVEPPANSGTDETFDTANEEEEMKIENNDTMLESLPDIPNISTSSMDDDDAPFVGPVSKGGGADDDTSRNSEEEKCIIQ